MTPRRLQPRRWSLALGAAVLAAAWLGPLPRLARDSFTAHMTLHMTVVAIAAPLLALAAAGGRLDPSRVAPRLLAPIPVSLVELVVVWAWHAPALHHAARAGGVVFALEQGSFLAAGLLLWIAALGAGGAGEAIRAPAAHQEDRTVDEAAAARSSRRGAGVVALLLTSMHMTLLGVLLALAPRALYVHDGAISDGSGAQALPAAAPIPVGAAQALDDQRVGGVLMLLVGGSSYLIGGLWLTAGMLRQGVPPGPTRRLPGLDTGAPRNAS